MEPLDILLVEDNTDHAELVIDTIADFNITNKITHLTDGEKAVQYLTECLENGNKLPEIILMDIKMPRMNGIETLQYVKSNSSIRHIPIIMVSTSSNQGEIDSCFAAGAASFLTKPLNFEDFAKKIRDLNVYWVMTSEKPKGISPLEEN